MALMVLQGSCSQATGQQLQKHYRYRFPVEELHTAFSARMMENARKEIADLERINREGIYKPHIDSLHIHPVPSWYADAKLGIFLDWGLYSVAGYGSKGWSRARYPDWYLSKMYNELSQYHIKTWGEDFERDDFIPLFNASGFKADYIVQLAAEAGAKYLVPFSKHHDGYCLWDSKYTQRDAVDMPPGRDLCLELIEACRKSELKHGFYFSVEDYEYPVIDRNNRLMVRLWSENMAPDNAGIAKENNEIYTPFIPDYHNRILSGKVPVMDFVNDYLLPQAKDYIDRYEPDILWFDGEWQRSSEYYRTPDLVAYFYNSVGKDKEIVVNDRFGIDTRGKSGDFYTSETDEVVEPVQRIWEENRSMSESYGYNRYDSLENYLSADELIKMFVRIVAKGGNLNLIVNLDGEGHLPQIQVDLLKELGAWLKINGEAIYGTVPYEVICDNTQLGQPVWYTRSKEGKYGYALIFDWPKSETFICKGANIIWGTEVYLLGYNKPLEWVDTGKKHWGMSARIPEAMLADPGLRPCCHVWVLRFEWDRENKF